MQFEEIRKNNYPEIQALMREQRGNLPIFVHPFFNLLTKPDVFHAPAYPAIQTELIQYINEDRPGIPSSYVQSLPAPIFKFHTDPQRAQRIEESHQRYYQHLMRFFASTTLPLMVLFEEENHATTSHALIKDTGYRGEIITVSTQESNPAPAFGYSFTDIMLFFAQISATRLIIGGQNSWLIAPNRAVDAAGPHIVEPLQRRGYNPMFGCVGAAFESLCDEIERLHTSEPAVQNMSLQLSKFVWPQRRSSDVSTLGR